MDAVQVAVAVTGGNLTALQGLYEVAEEGVNGAKLTEGINCTSRTSLSATASQCWGRSGTLRNQWVAKKQHMCLLYF